MARLRERRAEPKHADGPPASWLAREVHRQRYVRAIDPPDPGPFCSSGEAEVRARRRWARLTPDQRAQAWRHEDGGPDAAA